MIPRLPRLLTIMGSGETAPTMVKVHRSVVEHLGPGEVHGLLLDTPFGFQTNATEIAARAVTYFRDSVGATLEVAGLRGSGDLDGPAGDAIVAKLAAAPLVFAGPGSPTYALRQWQGTLVPPLLAEKLALGGALTFASAAALTLGAVTVPVYEVYKVGEDPHWVPGLDLLAAIGLHVALIPHYDNAEGGTHDTRFCYLGEQRLAELEHELPEGAFVLGVDEHTALCIDLDAQRATVAGHGGVTVRVQGRSARIEAGEAMALPRIVEIADELASGHAGTGRATGSAEAAGAGGGVAEGAGARPRTGPSGRPEGAGPTRSWPRGPTDRRCSGTSVASRSPSAPHGARRTSPPWWGPCSPSTTSSGRGARTPCSPTPWIGDGPACGPWSPSWASWPSSEHAIGQVSWALSSSSPSPSETRPAGNAGSPTPTAYGTASSLSGSRSTTPPRDRHGASPMPTPSGEVREGPC